MGAAAVRLSPSPCPTPVLGRVWSRHSSSTTRFRHSYIESSRHSNASPVIDPSSVLPTRVSRHPRRTETPGNSPSSPRAAARLMPGLQPLRSRHSADEAAGDPMSPSSGATALCSGSGRCETGLKGDTSEVNTALTHKRCSLRCESDAAPMTSGVRSSPLRTRPQHTSMPNKHPAAADGSRHHRDGAKLAGS